MLQKPGGPWQGSAPERLRFFRNSELRDSAIVETPASYEHVRIFFFASCAGMIR